MKRKNIFRSIAITLAALTAFSTMSVGVTSAAAASARDIGLSAANKSVDALVEMGADCIPGGKIFGAAGCAILDGLFGNLMSTDDDGPSSKDIDDHITRSTDEIRADISTMSQRMDTYHNAEMIRLANMSQMIQDVQAQQKTTSFETAYNETVTSNQEFISGINDNYISNTFVNDEYQLIDEDTRDSFQEIINGSDITHEFTLMHTYLGGKGSDRYSNFYSLMGDLLKTEYDARVYDALTKDKGEYVMGVTTADELSKLISYDCVENELKGYQADMLTYYASCVQAAQMQYDISNYDYYYKHINAPATATTKSGDQLCKDHLAVTGQNLTNKIKTLRGYMDDITNMYNQEMSYLESCKAADISLTVNGKDYNISFDDAGMACFTLNNFVYRDRTDNISNTTLNFDKDITVDPVLGLTQSQSFRDVLTAHGNNRMGVPDQINIIAKEELKDQKGYDYVINLNGHNIDMSAVPNNSFIGGFIVSGSLTINGQGGSVTSAGIFLHDAFERENYYKNITLNNVTMNEVKGASNNNVGFIVTIGKYHVTLNNSVINSYRTAVHQENGADLVNRNTVINQL